MHLVRLNPDGTVDRGFAYQMSGPDDTVFAISLQGPNMMVIGGDFTSVNEIPSERVARLHVPHSPPNRAPTSIFLTNESVVEGQPGGAFVGSFSAVDPDSDDTHTFSLIPGEGSEGNAYFEIDGNQLKTAAILHRENAESHSIRVRATDAGGDWTELTFAITVEPDLTPTDILLSNDWVVEGQPAGSMIGAFTTVDPEPDDTPGTWPGVEAILMQNDNEIVIGGWFTSVNGIASPRVARLHAGSAGPTGILLSSHSVQENQPAGTAVGTLSAIDLSGAGSHTFTFASGEEGNDNASFTIDVDTLQTAAVFDAAEQNAYTVRVRAANDSGLWVKQTLALTVSPDRYNAWAETLPENERGREDDPGGHGIPNIFRYAFGMDPVQLECAKLPQVGHVTQGTYSYLTITFTRRIDDTYLRYIVESSHDFETWSEPGRGSRIDVVDDGNGETESVTFTDNHTIDSRPKRFLRLRVER